MEREITMRKKMIQLFLGIFLLIGFSSYADVKISRIIGDVKVRRGLEENWQRAKSGMILKDIDTILSGEASQVVLELSEEIVFSLGGNAVLDIGDLKKITERELFLYLTSQKISKIERSGDEPKIHIENVSVVRGERKITSITQIEPTDLYSMWQLEINGVKALYTQEFYPNAIIKLYKIIEKYPNHDDNGEAHFILGQSFERVNEPGRAIDAYQTVLNKIKSRNDRQSKKIIEQTNEAIQRLKR